MLKYTVDKGAFDAMEDSVKALYKESGDTFTLQVEGVKTPQDVENVQEALRKEREEHGSTKDALKTATTINGDLTDKIKVYESDDSKKLSAEERVDMERLKRLNETLTTDNTDLSAKIDGITGQMTASQITDQLRTAAKGIIRDDAIDHEVKNLLGNFVMSDGKALTNSDLGGDSGLDAKAFLSKHVEGRSYLAPTSSGGGAGGGKGSSGGSQNTQSDEISIFQDLD